MNGLGKNTVNFFFSYIFFHNIEVHENTYKNFNIWWNCSLQWSFTV